MSLDKIHQKFCCKKIPLCENLNQNLKKKSFTVVKKIWLFWGSFWFIVKYKLSTNSSCPSCKTWDTVSQFLVDVTKYTQSHIFHFLFYFKVRFVISNCRTFFVRRALNLNYGDRRFGWHFYGIKNRLLFHFFFFFLKSNFVHLYLLPAWKYS